jgi:hypothetical protein
MASQPGPRPTHRTAAPRRRLPLLAALLAAIAAPDLSGQADLRFEGEYGLWVQEADSQMEVRWLTAAPDSGYLRVLAGGQPVQELRTPAGPAHLARFPRPRAAPLVLEYGALHDAADRHQTVIHPEPRRRDSPSFPAADSIFVLGDVHGEFDRMVALLRRAGVVDESLRWTGGRSHLVLAGDLMDRGNDVIRVLWFVYRLEREALRSGGRVHTVLGNHEILVMTDDLRYVAPKELLVAELHGASYSRMFDLRRSVLGRWLATKPSLLRIGRVLFAHGGVTPEFTAYTVGAYNDSIAAFMREDLFHRWSDTTYVPPLGQRALARRHAFFWSERSVFWYRGYVQEDTLDQDLERVLRHFQADLLVVGHTARPTIEERYGGALIAAHPRLPALEMLLLVRDGRRYRRYRYPPTGPPEPLGPLGGDGR